MLSPRGVPPCAWHTVNTDCSTVLPLPCENNHANAVFVDKLTKYVYAVAAMASVMLSTGQTCMLSMKLRMWAFLLSLFVIEALSSMFNDSSTRPEFSAHTWSTCTARHPQTDDQTECATQKQT